MSQTPAEKIPEKFAKVICQLPPVYQRCGYVLSSVLGNIYKLERKQE